MVVAGNGYVLWLGIAISRKKILEVNEMEEEI